MGGITRGLVYAASAVAITYAVYLGTRPDAVDDGNLITAGVVGLTGLISLVVNTVRHIGSRKSDGQQEGSGMGYTSNVGSTHGKRSTEEISEHRRRVANAPL